MCADYRLTIGLPVYNGERFLRDALKCFRKQSFRNFKIVISDNASTDDTSAIAERAAAEDARISHVREATNRGAIWNFNRCIDLADTEYFKWAAADDMCAPTYLEECIAVLDQHREVVCCHALTKRCTDDGSVLWDDDSPNAPAENGFGTASGPAPALRFRDVLLTSGWGVRSYGVIRTAALKRTPRLAPVFGSEKVLMAELALAGRFHDIDRPLFFQRVHEGSWSRQQCELPVDGVKNRDARELASAQPRLALGDRLKLLAGYWGVLRRAEISAGSKLKCAAYLAEYLLQWRKWKEIIRHDHR